MRDWCNKQLDNRDKGLISESLTQRTETEITSAKNETIKPNIPTNAVRKNSEDNSLSSKEDSKDDEEAVLELKQKMAKNKVKGARGSVSAESYGVFNKKGIYIPEVHPKSDEVKGRIRDRLSQAFMFSSLDETEKNIVINAMQECTFKAGEQVIKQDEEGSVLYCIDSGTLNCYRRMKSEDPEDTFLKTYEPGEAFGELALLYNAPRAATILAETDSICFSLGRDCFNNIVKESAIKRRKRYDEFVQKIEILNDLNTYERGKFTDCMATDEFKKDEFIIKQGELGDKFYFIEEGTCVATKKGGDNEEEKTVFEYKENDYFGELALLHETPRAASIKVTSEYAIVGVIDRSAFKRLLGPLEDLLKRNSDKYKKFEEKLKESMDSS